MTVTGSSSESKARRPGSDQAVPDAMTQSAERALGGSKSKEIRTCLPPVYVDLTGDPNDEGIRKNRWIENRRGSETQYLPHQASRRENLVSGRSSASQMHCRETTALLRRQNRHLVVQNKLLKARNQDLLKGFEHLRHENRELICINTEEHLNLFAILKNIVISNANIEAAVDAREAQMRVGLRNLRGTQEEIQEQAMQLLDFSSNTSFLVSRLVVGAMQDHQRLISDEEHRVMEKFFNDATPNAEIVAILEEKLNFLQERKDGKDDVNMDR